MDKFIKLSAIAKMAQPMGAFHGKDEETMGEDMEHKGCKCSCCGAPCEVCSEDDEESENEKESGYKPEEEY